MSNVPKKQRSVAKAQVVTPAATSATTSSASTASKVHDDIDSIFAAVKKTKPTVPTAASSASATTAGARGSSLQSKSTASLLALAAQRSKKSGKPGAFVPESTQRSTAVLDDAAFADSRGTSRKRKTIDGLKVYTEEELGLNNGGGDTELCPFDCTCCF
jgi:hypothetical protein